MIQRELMTKRKKKKHSRGVHRDQVFKGEISAADRLVKTIKGRKPMHASVKV